jgi:prolyl oligopeptidase
MQSRDRTDFIACAQYLIDDKYTSPARLAGSSGSAGGILIVRAITERICCSV